MDINVGQKHKKSFKGPDGSESGSKRGKTIDMLELIPIAEVARQPCLAFVLRQNFTLT